MKWAEVILFKEVIMNRVIDFFTHNVVYRFKVLLQTILDNDLAFKFSKFYKFVNHQKNWLVILFNLQPKDKWLGGAFQNKKKTLVKLLKKIYSKNNRGWHTKFINALWAYRSTYKTLNKATPYSILFEVEAILPFEVEFLSLQIDV